MEWKRLEERYETQDFTSRPGTWRCGESIGFWAQAQQWQPGQPALRNDFLAILLSGDARDALIFQRFAFTVADKQGANRRVEIEIRGGILATDSEPAGRKELKSVRLDECPFEGQRTFF